VIANKVIRKKSLAVYVSFIMKRKESHLVLLCRKNLKEKDFIRDGDKSCFKNRIVKQ
jgi:hypothetical protein